MSFAPVSATLAWASETDTEAFARRLAAQPGLRDAFIELRGDLGAGKTTFVRHLLRALGVRGRIKSPTYAVVEPHELALPEGLLHIWHFDFYRFNDPREWEEAGFRDLFASPGLKLAEWPEKAQGMLPEPDLVLTLGLAAPLDASAHEPGEAARRVQLHAGSPRGLALLEAVRA